MYKYISVIGGCYKYVDMYNTLKNFNGVNYVHIINLYKCYLDILSIQLYIYNNFVNLESVSSEIRWNIPTTFRWKSKLVGIPSEYFDGIPTNLKFELQIPIETPKL